MSLLLSSPDTATQLSRRFAMEKTKSRFKVVMFALGLIAFGGIGTCCGGYVWMVWAIGESDRKHREQHPQGRTVETQ
jgi:hypothetical protein